MPMQRYDRVVQDASGNIVRGASVLVKLKGTGATATIYSDEGVTPITNPMTTDGAGRFFFYALSGEYIIDVTAGGSTYTLAEETLDAYARTEFIKKAAATDLVNDNTLNDDPHLVGFNVLNGETVEFRFLLRITTTANADFRFSVVASAAGAGQVTYRAFRATVVEGTGSASLGTNVGLTYGGAASLNPLFLDGFWIATADGTIKLQWAQGASHPDTTTVGINSFATFRRVD